jgi:hypothetical protein
MRGIGIAATAAVVLSCALTAAADGTPAIFGTAGRGVLAPEREISLVSSDAVFETAAGSIRCSSVAFNGTLSAITSATFTGPNSRGCHSSLRLPPPRPHRVYPHAEVSAERLPWRFVVPARVPGRTKIARRTPEPGRTNLIRFAVTFPGAPEVLCIWKTLHISLGRLDALPLEPITFTATALFKIHHPTHHQPCPEEGEFSGTFTMTSGGEAVELTPSLG